MRPSTAPALVAHVITGLNPGGAETMLLKLLGACDRVRFAPTVYSLLPPGPIASRIEALGVPVHSVGMRRGVPDPLGALRLWKLLRAERPSLVQTWMIHADLVGGLAARPLGIPLVWNIRHGMIDRRTNSAMTRASERACGVLSRWLPARIVCASETARQRALALRFDSEKLLVIPNGFDLDAFKPDPEARASVRSELSIPLAAPLVGLVARADPAKDHATFVRAAAEILRHRDDVHFVLCGDGVDRDNPMMQAMMERAGIASRTHLLGRRPDVSRIQAALDVACSSSISEGFPNVIGEAMACEVPCAVTDVGDSAEIVGDTGRTSRPGDAEALASSVLTLLQPGVRQILGPRARERIRSRYDINSIAGRYQDLHQELIDACAA